LLLESGVLVEHAEVHPRAGGLGRRRVEVDATDHRGSREADVRHLDRRGGGLVRTEEDGGAGGEADDGEDQERQRQTEAERGM